MRRIMRWTCECLGPSHRRPVILLSALYRVWASIHAAEFRHWPRAEGVPPAALSSAEFRAAERALALDMADDEVAGLAVDWSKFHLVPLATIEAIARAAHVHPAVWRPMLADCQVPRRLRATTLAGPAHVPVRGLPPGCLAAMHWLALLMRAGGAGPAPVAASLDPRQHRRLGRAGHGAAGDGPGRLRMGAHQGLPPRRGGLLEGKCAFRAHSAAARRAREALVDLGAPQRAGPAKRGGGPGMPTPHAERMRRKALLALPWGARTRLMATARVRSPDGGCSGAATAPTRRAGPRASSTRAPSRPC